MQAKDASGAKGIHQNAEGGDVEPVPELLREDIQNLGAKFRGCARTFGEDDLTFRIYEPANCGEENIDLRSEGAAGNLFDGKTGGAQLRGVDELRSFVVGDDAELFAVRAESFGEAQDGAGLTRAEKTADENKPWFFGLGILQFHAVPVNLLRDDALGNGQIHLTREIENAAALRAGDDFLLGLAGKDHLLLQFHVATTTETAIDADDSVRAALLAKTDVTVANAFFDGLLDLGVVGFQLGEFACEAHFFVRQGGAGELDILESGRGLFCYF